MSNATSYTLTSERNAQGRVTSYTVTFPHVSGWFNALDFTSAHKARAAALKWARGTQKREADTRALIKALPPTLPQLQERCHACNTSLLCVRNTLYLLIEAGTLSLEEIDRLAPFCRVLDMSDYAHLLSSLVTSAPCVKVREAAFAAIFHAEQGRALEAALSADQVARLSAPWVRSMMRQNDFHARYLLRALYIASKAKETLIETLEGARAQVNAPLTVYKELDQVISAQHKAMIFGLAVAR